MIVVLPFHHRDLSLLRELLRWLIELDGQSKAHALLVCDCAVPYGQALDVLTLAREAFTEASIIHNEKTITGWPAGPNSLWLAAAKHVEEQFKKPWLFLEPDAIPLKPGWLGALFGEYHLVGNPFLGRVLLSDKATLPLKHLNGVAIYPRNAFTLLGKLVQDSDLAFDLSSAAESIPIATNSKLIQVVWGQQNNPPTFAAIAQPGTRIFGLENLESDAVLFHRNKDLTLINLLRQKLFPERASRGSMVVVIPFCNADGLMFERNLRWWVELQNGAPFPLDCLLSYENNTLPHIVTAMHNQASRLFRAVHTTFYGHGAPDEWMQTIAFRHAAKTVHLRFNKPFLWTEYDMIPMKPDWLLDLIKAYHTTGKPFAGPIVNGMGHMNGTGFYPADTPLRIPVGINSTKTAWDVAMKREMIHQCANLGHLMFHCWGVFQGKLHPYHGNAPSFQNHALLSQIPAGALTFHRCKDGSLIDRLREKGIHGR